MAVAVAGLGGPHSWLAIRASLPGASTEPGSRPGVATSWSCGLGPEEPRPLLPVVDEDLPSYRIQWRQSGHDLCPQALSDGQGAGLEHVIVNYLVENVGKHHESKSWRVGVRVGGKVPTARSERDSVRPAARVFVRKGTPARCLGRRVGSHLVVAKVPAGAGTGTLSRGPVFVGLRPRSVGRETRTLGLPPSHLLSRPGLRDASLGQLAQVGDQAEATPLCPHLSAVWLWGGVRPRRAPVAPSVRGV